MISVEFFYLNVIHFGSSGKCTLIWSTIYHLNKNSIKCIQFEDGASLNRNRQTCTFEVYPNPSFNENIASWVRRALCLRWCCPTTVLGQLSFWVYHKIKADKFWIGFTLIAIGLDVDSIVSGIIDDEDSVVVSHSQVEVAMVENNRAWRCCWDRG